MSSLGTPRSRAVRYFLTFMISGATVSMIAILYTRGGFDLILGATAIVALDVRRPFARPLKCQNWRLSPISACRLGIGKFPRAVQDFGTRPIEPHRVVPAGHDRQAVWDFSVAAAELDCDSAIRVLLRRNVVERIGVVWIFSK